MEMASHLSKNSPTALFPFSTLLMNVFVLFSSHKSVVVAADNSVVSWGSHPTYGELVCAVVIVDKMRTVCHLCTCLKRS